ncbi:MAG TPA: hypothetical protein VK980_03080 [Sphingomonas sp.]|nr:hypothetical protein [Sphingomonas sp.]
MHMVLIIAQSIALTLASAAAGTFLCLSSWLLFRLVRHPQWAPLLVLAAIAFAAAGKLPDSEFLRRTLVFAVAAAGPFWIAGLVWCANRRNRSAASAECADTAPAVGAAPSRAPPYLRYPAIAACICEARRPSPAEVRKVTKRIWQEAFATRFPSPGFAERRTALRAARAALEGS